LEKIREKGTILFFKTQTYHRARLLVIAVIVISTVMMTSCIDNANKGTIINREHTEKHSRLVVGECGFIYDGKFACGSARLSLVTTPESWHLSIRLCNGEVRKIEVSKKQYSSSSTYWDNGPKDSNPC